MATEDVQSPINSTLFHKDVACQFNQNAYNINPLTDDIIMNLIKREPIDNEEVLPSIPSSNVELKKEIQDFSILNNIIKEEYNEESNEYNSTKNSMLEPSYSYSINQTIQSSRLEESIENEEERNDNIINIGVKDGLMDISYDSLNEQPTTPLPRKGGNWQLPIDNEEDDEIEEDEEERDNQHGDTEEGEIEEEISGENMFSSRNKKIPMFNGKTQSEEEAVERISVVAKKGPQTPPLPHPDDIEKGESLMDISPDTSPITSSLHFNSSSFPSSFYSSFYQASSQYRQYDHYNHHVPYSWMNITSYQDDNNYGIIRDDGKDSTNLQPSLTPQPHAPQSHTLQSNASQSHAPTLIQYPIHSTWNTYGKWLDKSAGENSTETTKEKMNKRPEISTIPLNSITLSSPKTLFANNPKRITIEEYKMRNTEGKERKKEEIAIISSSPSSRSPSFPPLPPRINIEEKVDNCNMKKPINHSIQNIKKGTIDTVENTNTSVPSSIPSVYSVNLIPLEEIPKKKRGRPRKNGPPTAKKPRLTQKAREMAIKHTQSINVSITREKDLMSSPSNICMQFDENNMKSKVKIDENEATERREIKIKWEEIEKEWKEKKEEWKKLEKKMDNWMIMMKDMI